MRISSEAKAILETEVYLCCYASLLAWSLLKRRYEISKSTIIHYHMTRITFDHIWPKPDLTKSCGSSVQEVRAVAGSIPGLPLAKYQGVPEQDT